jgi:hypothetical protein
MTRRYECPGCGRMASGTLWTWGPNGCPYCPYVEGGDAVATDGGER